RAYLAQAGLFCDAERAIAIALWERAENRRRNTFGLRTPDMKLPGGVEVEEAAGERRYNTSDQEFTGTFSRNLNLPGQGLLFVLITGSLSSGGAVELRLRGCYLLAAE